MRIPVVFATDENYIFYACVAISSMALNANKDTFYDIYVLVNDSFSDEYSLFHKLQEKYDNICLNYLKVDSSHFQHVIINNGHVTKTTFYRLILGELLPEDKCIYLDADLIVTDDLEELYSTDIEGYYVGGCRDLWLDLMDEDKLEQRRIRTELPSMNQYINAGVLLLNLKQIREDNMQQHFMTHLKKDYLFEDQDILNVCCYQKIKFLNPRWNIFTLFMGCQKEMEQKGIPEITRQVFREREGIIHYATPYIRPWKHFECHANDLWWKYAKEWEKEDCYQILLHRILMNYKDVNREYQLARCDASERIVIFGFTGYSRGIADNLLRCGYREKLMFCDNDEEKQKCTYEGCNVYPLSALLEDNRATVWFNAGRKRKEEVNSILVEAGIQEESIINFKYYDHAFYQYVDEKYYHTMLCGILGWECSIRCEKLSMQDTVTCLKRQVIYEDLVYKYHMKSWLLKDDKE